MKYGILLFILIFQLQIVHSKGKASSLNEVVSILQKRSKDTKEIKEVFFGRILRGKRKNDFSTMTLNPDRKIVFYVDSKGLEKMVGISNVDRLLKIGYPKKYIKQKVLEGYKFKLVVFNGSETVKNATWDNVVSMVEDIYGHNEISKKLRNNIDTLKEMYSLYSAPYAYNLIKGVGGELWEVRKFLEKELNLNILFKGDGFTYNEKGVSGMREYISPNVKLSGLKEARLIDLNIENQK